METLGTRVPDDMLTAAEDWLLRGVGCVVGRAHYGRGRFAVSAVSTKAEFREIRARFGRALAEQGMLSCLVLVEPENNELPKMTIAELVKYLDYTYFGDDSESSRRIVDSVRGTTYSLAYDLRCPVTGVTTTYPDFDQVAFYPQATDRNDPLYDPSMHAPFVCFNITSDIYGFSLTAADIRARAAAPKPGFTAMQKPEREEIYEKALRRFQMLAEKTIQNYGHATDPNVIEPIHVTPDGNYYIAQHDESAFIETVKSPFRNEMPARYARRIIEQWERYFQQGIHPDMTSVYAPSARL
jgi:hypothetical protein